MTNKEELQKEISELKEKNQRLLEQLESLAYNKGYLDGYKDGMEKITNIIGKADPIKKDPKEVSWVVGDWIHSSGYQDKTILGKGHDYQDHLSFGGCDVEANKVINMIGKDND